MLRELQSNKKNPINLDYLSKFYVVSKRIQNDPRFKMVDERDREELFQDFVERIGDQEKEAKRELSLKNIEQFRKDLKGDKSINLDTPWSYIEDRYYYNKDASGKKSKDGDEPAFIASKSFDQKRMDLLQ